MSAWNLRIKVRTLIIIVILGPLLGWYGYSQLPSLLYSNGQSQLVMKWFPDSTYAERASNEQAYRQYQSINVNSYNHNFFMTTGEGSGMGGESPSKEQRAADIKKLESYRESHGDEQQSNQLDLILAKLYLWKEEWEKAEVLFRQSLQEGMGDVSSQALYNMLESRRERVGETPSLEGEVHIGDKQVTNAVVFLQDADDNSWITPPYGAYPMTITDDEGQYRFYDVMPGEYKVGVGVKPEQIADFTLSETKVETIVIEQQSQQALLSPPSVDFQFVPRVKLLSPTNRETIEGDELQFRWEPYEGAAYYKVNVTIVIKKKDEQSYSSSTKEIEGEPILSNEVTYSLDDLRKQKTNLFFSGDSEGNISYSPAFLLGMAYPGGEFLWSVDAYNAEGSKLSSSTGSYLGADKLVPHFRIPEEGMQEGDRFVIAYQYEEAIAAYEMEGNNPHALRVLAKLADNGITANGGDGRKALAYLERLPQPEEEDLAEMERLRKKIASIESSGIMSTPVSDEHALQLLNKYEEERK